MPKQLTPFRRILSNDRKVYRITTNRVKTPYFILGGYCKIPIFHKI